MEKVILRKMKGDSKMRKIYMSENVKLFLESSDVKLKNKFQNILDFQSVEVAKVFLEES